MAVLAPALSRALGAPLLSLQAHLAERRKGHVVFLQKLLVLQETVESLVNKGDWAGVVTKTTAFFAGKIARARFVS